MSTYERLLDALQDAHGAAMDLSGESGFYITEGMKAKVDDLISDIQGDWDEVVVEDAA